MTSCPVFGTVSVTCVLTRHLSPFRQTECIPIPDLSLLQVSHLDADMADAAQRNDLSLRFVGYRITADRKLHRVAVGIKNEKRLFDRTGRSVIYRTMPFKFPLFGRARHGGQIIRRDFETVDDAFQWSRRRGRNRKVLQRDAPTFVICQRVKNNLRHFAVEPADIQVGEMIDLPTHETSPEAMRPPEVVARNHAVIDAFYRYLFNGSPYCFLHPTLNLRLPRSDSRQSLAISLILALLPPIAIGNRLHLMTFSARISTTGGIVRPSALAVFKLIISSNFVGCSTGKSAGLAPFRILSTIDAARL